MFEKRSIWGLIVGLNVCLLIWMIAIQEPVMFDANTAAISSVSGSNFVINLGTAEGESTKISGRGDTHYLSKLIQQPNNEYVNEIPKNFSTLTTFNFYKNNNNSKNKNFNSTTSTKETIYSNRNDVNTTTTIKTSDLPAGMQSLTSSLGTEVLHLKREPISTKVTLSAVSSALPDKDFYQLIDLHNFQFLMPQPICGNHIEALILIHSAPKNYEKRQVIRETWASISHYTAKSPLRVLFLLGAVISHQLQEDLQNENNLNKDIIQGSFLDDYRNMTYKHIMAFKWFIYNCPQAQILIKVDDDVYVNTPQLIKYLKEQQLQNNTNYNKSNPTTARTVTQNKTVTSYTTNATTRGTTNTTAKHSMFYKLNIFATETPALSAASASITAFDAFHELFDHPQNLLFCQKIIGSMVKRSYRSKWRVSFKEYSGRYYPPYCPGYAIIYSSDVIFRLYRAAQSSHYFWIDDVHITGVLAQQTGTKITNSSKYVLYSKECDQILTGKTDLSKIDFLFAWHNLSGTKIKLLWHLQMMSMQMAVDLNFNKFELNDTYEMQRQQRQELPGNVGNIYLVNNRISSSHKYTSSNNFR